MPALTGTRAPFGYRSWRYFPCLSDQEDPGIEDTAKEREEHGRYHPVETAAVTGETADSDDEQEEAVIARWRWVGRIGGMAFSFLYLAERALLGGACS